DPLRGQHAVENCQNACANGQPQCKLTCHQFVSRSKKRPDACAFWAAEIFPVTDPSLDGAGL
ncbi:MAG TPA: hypothetical protein VF389_01425, partial [Woeseiaceae bacterium]